MGDKTWSFMQSVGWDDFITGEWTREIPTRPGRYPVADPAGLEAGYVSILDFKGEFLYIREQHRSTDVTEIWKYWWWSEPHPPLPPASPII